MVNRVWEDRLLHRLASLREKDMYEMLIGLAGYAGVGKDEVAKYLSKQYGFSHAKFAQPIKDLLYIINPEVQVAEKEVVRLQKLVDDDGWDWCKQNYPIVREMLQLLGTEGGREFWYYDVWVDRALKNIGGEEHVVFSDARFDNERAAIWNLGGENWLITRKGFEPVNAHISDNAWTEDTKFDRVITNDWSLPNLRATIDEEMKRLGLTKVGG